MCDGVRSSHTATPINGNIFGSHLNGNNGNGNAIDKSIFKFLSATLIPKNFISAVAAVDFLVIAVDHPNAFHFKSIAHRNTHTHNICIKGKLFEISTVSLFQGPPHVHYCDYLCKLVTHSGDIQHFLVLTKAKVSFQINMIFCTLILHLIFTRNFSKNTYSIARP